MRGWEWKDGMVEYWNGEILEAMGTKLWSDLVRNAQIYSDLLRLEGSGSVGIIWGSTTRTRTIKRKQPEEVKKDGRTRKKVEILGLEYWKDGTVECWNRGILEGGP